MTLPRIALIGMGHMGQALRAAMRESGAEPVVCIDPDINGCARETSAGTLADAEVCVEFTRPDTVRSNLLKVIEAGKDVVVGTTGWNAYHDEIAERVREAGTGLLWASNFSVGVHLFSRLAAEAARLLDAYDEYDVALHETHHRGKRDAPSGTALTVAEAMLGRIMRKTHIVSGNPRDVPVRDALYISSTRVGEVMGQHRIMIDGPFDGLELVHTARSRGGFARGALLAASWIHRRKGFYSIEDMFDDIESV